VRHRLAVFAFAAALAAIPTLASASNAPRLASPTKVKLAIAAGGVNVSWAPTTGAVSYTVTTTPATLPCTTTTTKCFVPVSTLTPLRFIVTATSNTASASSSPSTVVTPRLTLVVAGQSNAMGAESYAIDPTTNVNYFASPHTNQADTKDSLYFDEWFTSPVPKSSPHTLDTPQIWPSPKGTRQFFGPELSLARQVYADTHQPATLIKVAFPDTALATNWSLANPQSLYFQMVSFVNARLAQDAATSQLDVVAGFYWYQGENDAMNLSYAAAYQSNLQAMFQALRPAIHMNSAAPIGLVEPSIAAVITAMEATGTCSVCAAYQTGNNEVRSADQYVAANLANVYLVDSEPLPRTGLGIHLSNTGELALGTELATATDAHYMR